jgi:hypothetical protein
MKRWIAGVAGLLVACGTITAPRLGDTFALRVGHSVTVADVGLRLRFVAVAADSRCPSQVMCVWAGDAVLLIESTTSGGEASLDTLRTTTGPTSVRLGRVELRLVRLDPYPATPGAIAGDVYVVTLETRSVP